MKKIISVLLVVVMMVAILPFSVFAIEDNSSLTNREVYGLLLKVAYLLEDLCGFKMDSHIVQGMLRLDNNDTEIVSSDVPGISDAVYIRVLSSSGVVAIPKHYEAFNWEMSTQAELLAAMQESCTEATSNQLYSVMTDTLKTIRIKNGNLYLLQDTSQATMLKRYGYMISGILGVKDVKVSGNTATAVAVLAMRRETNNSAWYMEVPVTLEKVNGEWRLSENLFFTRVFSDDYNKYTVRYDGMKTPLTPNLTGDTLSDDDISWLVEVSNSFLLNLGMRYNNTNIRLKENRIDHGFNVRHQTTVKPYIGSNLPQYVTETGFNEIYAICLDYPVQYSTKINGEADFRSYIYEFFTENAANDYIDVLVNRMYALYISEGKVYKSNFGYFETMNPIVTRVSKVKGVTYSEGSAVAEVELMMTGFFDLDPMYTTVSIKLERTSEGWRMAENIYGSKIYEKLVDEELKYMRDCVPDIFPLPDLSASLTREGAMMAAERAFQTAYFFNYREVFRAKIIGEQTNGVYLEGSFKAVGAHTQCGICFDGAPEGDPAYGTDHYYVVVNPNVSIDFFGRRLSNLEDVGSFVGEFATGRAKDVLQLFFTGEPAFVQYPDGSLRTQQRDMMIGTVHYYLIDYGAFKINGNTATLEVTLGKFSLEDDGSGRLEPKPATVTFQKTSDGWRISGGTMFSLLYGESYTEQAPATADASPLLVFLSIISLASACTACKKRRAR